VAILPWLSFYEVHKMFAEQPVLYNKITARNINKIWMHFHRLLFVPVINVYNIYCIQNKTWV
jgi:hypothetical protein